MLLGACEPAPTVAPPEPETEAETEAEPEPEPPSCVGAPGFEDYAFIPDDAQLATAIAPEDPDLDAALAQLGELSETASIPVYAALDYRNLGLQLGNLARILDALGLAPGELVELRSPAGVFVWLVPVRCEPASFAARMAERFGVILRADYERPGVRVGSGTPERFPFDVLSFGDQRVGLTLLGQGPAVGAWLLGDARGGEDGPGRALAEIEAAPIRSVLRGEALLTGPGEGPSLGLLNRPVRASASSWEIGEPPEPTP